MEDEKEVDLKSRGENYKEFLNAFGIKFGMKTVIARWMSHFTSKKIPYKIKTLWGENVWVRINSSDVDLAKKIIGKNGGEYDFLSKIENIESFKCIIDAGANIGLFSIIARKYAPRARIIAIEPDVGNYVMYLKNLGIGENDIAIHAGLWNKSCKLVMESRNTGDVGFIVYESDMGNIKAVSMEDIVKNNNISHIDILKMDIEGSEYEVFDETAEKWIDMVGILIVETHDRIKTGCAERVHERLMKHGYSHMRYGENDVYQKIGRV